MSLEKEQGSVSVIKGEHRFSINFVSGAYFTICSVGIDDLVVIHGIKIIQTESELSIRMPMRVLPNEKHKPVVTFIDKSFKKELEEAVIDAYLRFRIK